MYGKGSGGATNSGRQNFFDGVPFADILATSLLDARFPGPSQRSLEMMAMGRPSFNWAAMGALAPLAGFIPQPEYRSAPPSPLLQEWGLAGPYYIDNNGNIANSIYTTNQPTGSIFDAFGNIDWGGIAAPGDR